MTIVVRIKYEMTRSWQSGSSLLDRTTKLQEKEKSSCVQKLQISTVSGGGILPASGFLRR
jgi:hypothetical protein